ncbi:MAG TPA: pyridoxal-phosphate dependent enzyme [Pyrinomonadaceae bacterium]|nr:pyridoxal-phosphate dependent enzyme [Pyrinomonadaceae bacterium]
MESAVPTVSPPDVITLADVESARLSIAPFINRTPLIRSHTLSRLLGTNVHLKLEMVQRTGAFKVRGAFNRMLALSDLERRSGVVAVSGGNHAQAVACAARDLGIKALVLMPACTPDNYVRSTADMVQKFCLYRPWLRRSGALVTLKEVGLSMCIHLMTRSSLRDREHFGLEILEDALRLLLERAKIVTEPAAFH